MKEILSQSIWDLLYLVACALHGQVPASEKIHAMNLADVYGAAKFHSLTAITAMALESANGFQFAPPELAKRWKEEKEKVIRKNLLLDAEREQILRYMEEHGIWYMPLKGSILKDLYPKYGMRQMVDNDILYDSAFQQQMHRFMAERGYKAVNFKKSNDDAYEKPPVYNFELHTTLFAETRHPVWYGYYKIVKARLIKDEGRTFGYHFRDEDFYIYLVVHGCKHYNHSGTGLRSLVDTYIFTEKKGAALDWNYIATELKKLNVSDFEQQTRLLARKLFSDPAQLDAISLTEDEQTMLSCFAGSGTFGTTESLVEKKMKAMLPEGKQLTAMGKLRYLWARLFPDLEWFQKYEPFYAKHSCLIPFFLVFRVFRGIAFRRRKMKGELKALSHAGKETPD